MKIFFHHTKKYLMREEKYFATKIFFTQELQFAKLQNLQNLHRANFSRKWSDMSRREISFSRKMKKEETIELLDFCERKKKCSSESEEYLFLSRTKIELLKSVARNNF